LKATSNRWIESARVVGASTIYFSTAIAYNIYQTQINLSIKQTLVQTNQEIPIFIAPNTKP